MKTKNSCVLKKALINLLSFSSLTILCTLFFTAFFPVSQADAFQAELKPASIRQGDAFLLRVTGLNRSIEPSAMLNKKPLRFSSCGEGCFVAIGAVDLNARAGVYRIPLKIGQHKSILRLRVLKGRFETIHLTLPEEKVSPVPEDIDRIKREAGLLTSIWEIDSERLMEGGFVFPLENPLSTPFGTKRIINKETVSIHRGLDIKGKEGEDIHASNRGRVVLTEELFFGGNTLILDHGHGIFTVYMHLSGFNVGLGDLVSKNDVIGFVGSSGRSSGPHLHFGVKVTGMNINPVSITRLRL
ncbi:MAG: hypothetical protein CVV37_04960 [Nitrospira bacterium HGW-Nitrospira-1]|nr:MAG: hypothetical protein CVV37_04960 [Nitrospira bacterium HGW-Nitrospira-1]